MLITYDNINITESLYKSIDINCENIKNNTELYNIILENLFQIYYSNKDNCKLFQGIDNKVFQVTNLNNEHKALKSGFINNQNLSIIDFGECESTLREEYHIQKNVPLVILKQETLSNKSLEKNIEYDVFLSF